MNKYNKDLVKLITSHYNLNSREAEEYIDLFKKTNGGLNHLNELLKMYGKTEKEIKKLNDKIDRLQKTIEDLNVKLSKHIKFIDSTYEGLKNPIEAARKWLRK